MHHGSFDNYIYTIGFHEPFHNQSRIYLVCTTNRCDKRHSVCGISRTLLMITFGVLVTANSTSKQKNGLNNGNSFQKFHASTY